MYLGNKTERVIIKKGEANKFLNNDENHKSIYPFRIFYQYRSEATKL